MTWWFKKYPELLERECRLLESNSNYKEKCRWREALLLSSGEIIVRLNETTKHPVLILFPESTPYSLPKVFLLNQVLNEEELKKLSALSSTGVIKAISDKIKFHNYWHQNYDGSLCLLEADNLEKYGEFFTITDIINRARDWLAGLTTGNYPPDSPGVDIFGHFRFKDHHNRFLLPESFCNDDVTHGELYSILYSHPYRDDPVSEQRIFMGAMFVGMTAAGVLATPTHYHNRLMPIGLQSLIEIYTKKEQLNELISKGTMVKTYWWQVNKIDPISSIPELVSLIGGGDAEAGYSRVLKSVGNEINKLPDSISFAIRFKSL